MNIPIEIIIFVLGTFTTITTAVVVFFWKSIAALKTGFDEVKQILVANQTANKFEEKECAAKHDYIGRKMKDHDTKLADHEKRLLKIER